MKRACLSTVLMALTVAVSASACAAEVQPSRSGEGGCTIAFLLPENTTPRYEAKDHPLFLDAVKAQDPSCKVLYFNAANAADKQQQQAESALSQGAQVLVLDAANVTSSAAIVQEAKAKGVPTVAYDRTAGGPLAYRTGFDNVEVGKTQANAMIKAMQAAGHSSGNIVMINGAPDTTGAFFKQGAHEVFDKSGYKIAAEYDTDGWSPTNATTEMTQAIAKVGAHDIAGVYAANDTLAGAAITAMRQAGISPIPPVTGLDATDEGLQRIVLGTQYMTTYKNLKAETDAAAKIAILLAHGKPLPSAPMVKNVTGDDVPTQLLPPIAVTVDTIKSTVIADGFATAAEVCGGGAADACARAGITG
ncbi:substrate-binding domain-containing protein [Amycolatopsis rhabdoformis]|uniref:Substrate-binding domain-containing protein n=1 Tax=Amycolatopsis rhabdoformis TaxID=1448059 RepID=A0ABZ1IIR2_9PSEU|nr:substrate-binding domain-containing protein [Amycolatopsis rhabdoformis]WSE34063.1 substrate-binding domain-containing protein [Amycolatopsis rhabdoformis]